jgi:bifunctional pyridoxal-dependent enzyme with beta-cystathionase and maltose regulon repressor activities
MQLPEVSYCSFQPTHCSSHNKAAKINYNKEREGRYLPSCQVCLQRNESLNNVHPINVFTYWFKKKPLETTVHILQRKSIIISEDFVHADLLVQSTALKVYGRKQQQNTSIICFLAP